MRGWPTCYSSTSTASRPCALVNVSEHYEPSRHTTCSSFLCVDPCWSVGRPQGGGKAAVATLAFRKAHDLDAENFATKPESSM